MAKLAAPAATIGYIAAAGLPLPQFAYAIAVFVEIVGGLALIAGYYTRVAAAAGGLLQILSFGGGRFSLDSRRPMNRR